MAYNEKLAVRVQQILGPAQYDALLSLSHVHPMDFAGRPMRGCDRSVNPAEIDSVAANRATWQPIHSS
jgi:hypothetical protein